MEFLFKNFNFLFVYCWSNGYFCGFVWRVCFGFVYYYNIIFRVIGMVYCVCYGVYKLYIKLSGKIDIMVW